MNSEPKLPASETDALLRQILKAVEPAKSRSLFEIACAIILALATTASAWCAYQSKLWGGAQMARGNAAVRASREEAVASLAAMQARAFDATMFISYMQARFEQNQAMENFLRQRFRPEMKTAVEAWLNQGATTNLSAPPSPLHLAEYVQKEITEINRLEAIAGEAQGRAQQARQASDNYVLLTVLFASVLFFGGIARAFDARSVRTVLTILAVLLFLGTLCGLLTMPICHE